MAVACYHNSQIVGTCFEGVPVAKQVRSLHSDWFEQLASSAAAAAAAAAVAVAVTVEDSAVVVETAAASAVALAEVVAAAASSSVVVVVAYLDPENLCLYFARCAKGIYEHKQPLVLESV